MVNRPTWLRRTLRAVRGRRANVAMLTALLIPAMTGATGLGVEISFWNVRTLELQRIADHAALAAATAKNAGASTQSATNAGADIAELNGIAGAATRSWSSSTNTLTDNTIVVKQVAGIQAATNTAYQVQLRQDVPLVIAKLVTSVSSVPLAVTGYAELIPPKVPGCLLILGNTSSSLYMDNGAKVDETGCATRSNGSIVVKGGAKLYTSGVMAAGTISATGSSQITGPTSQNAATFTDPYASYTPLQNALTLLGSGGTTLSNGTGTVSPGTYSSLNFTNGSITMQPGLYVINGPVHINNGAKVSGTGVTIISNGQWSIDNGSSVTLTAPTKTATAGVPGVVMAGTSNSDFALNGGSQFFISGVIYYPNGHIQSDNGFGSSIETCSVLLAKTVTINGGAKLANNCTSDSGVLSLPVPVGTPTVALVK